MNRIRFPKRPNLKKTFIEGETIWFCWCGAKPYLNKNGLKVLSSDNIFHFTLPEKGIVEGFCKDTKAIKINGDYYKNKQIIIKFSEAELYRLLRQYVDLTDEKKNNNKASKRFALLLSETTLVETNPEWFI